MRKTFVPFLLIPMLLTSCGQDSISLDDAKKIVSNFSTETMYPYYKVIGKLDFNGEITPVDATFDQTPSTDSFVPYARYNEGFFNESVDPRSSDFDIIIYAMASRSYWLRAPLRINSENFFAYGKNKATGEYTTSENNTCAHYIIEHLITSYLGQAANANPSSMHMVMEALPDGGIRFSGNKVHTNVTIDNYPYYPDYNAHPELYPWKDYNPLPCYSNTVNAKVNIFFEYNKDGWLTKESMYTIDYDPDRVSADQVALEAVYSYEFGPANP